VATYSAQVQQEFTTRNAVGSASRVVSAASRVISISCSSERLRSLAQSCASLMTSQA